MVTMTDNDGRRISDMTYEEKKQKLQEQMLVYAQRYVGRIFGRSRQ